mmetsp:Transcript_21571/g.56033  ORF Transcript_21571/g.56033 Transcript_21571/m.56033 type:complete len:214 (-) Transcript_21571:57-698(-)
MWKICAIAALCSLISGVAAAHEDAGEGCTLYSKRIESPCFITLSTKEDYTIREYNSTSEFWTMTTIDTSDYRKASRTGFERNFKFISGQNSKEEKIPMTAPVLLTRKEGEDKSTVFTSSFFVPSAYSTSGDMPVPNADLGVSIVQMKHSKVAVIEFSGYATETDYDNYTQKLRALLDADKVDYDSSEVSILAQYDSPFAFFNRHNEVWVPLSE